MTAFAIRTFGPFRAERCEPLFMTGPGGHRKGRRGFGPFGPGGRYGNALLVRGRTLRTSTLRLPGSGEPRVALFARVVVADAELTVVSTHLQNRTGGRPSEAPAQLAALLDELTDWPRPWCVMGDLNLRADTVLPILEEAGLTAVRSGPTFPATAPRVRIDWIATQGLGDGEAVVPDLRTSDHRPVVAAFDFPHADGTDADPRAEPHV